MKKIILISLFLLLTVGYAEKFDLSDPLVVEKFGANIVKNKLETYDKEALGLWYLQNKYQDKWSKVRNDEFELDDAKIWAVEQLKKKLDKVKQIDKNSEYHLNLRITFNKYDFKSKSFPIEALTENSYMSYAGKGEFVNSYRDSKLVFEKFDDSVNSLPMQKDDAKKFIKVRKDTYGSIDRELSAHYVYVITEFEEDNEFSSSGNPMTIKFTGKLKSVEFMDKNGKQVLSKVDFTKSTNSNNEQNLSK